MNEIGILLKMTRESAGVSMEEASGDLHIKEIILSNIEDGNIGGFKDIFILKEYIHDYAKYLGLDADKIIDEFNEYLFEYTSKIPVKQIEKAVREKQEMESATKEHKVVSPYTEPKKKHKKVPYILIYSLVVILIIIVVIWAIKIITIDNEVANTVSYVK